MQRECTAINDGTFARNENKQAYFKGLEAGTEELIERAKPFQ